MSIFQLAWRGFCHYYKRHLPVISGVALSTTVLTGALFIGDSMRYSLEQITLSRLGKITHLITVTDRYFRADLASEISLKAKVPVAPVQMMGGSAIADGGADRVNNVQFIGTDSRFGAVSGTDIFNDIPDDEIIINENLAHRLNVKPGDVLLLRIAKANLMPGNTPFVSENETTVALRSKIRLIASREQMGYFNLKNSQTTPNTVFMPLNRLNRLMEFSGRANRLLVAGELPVDRLKEILDQSLQPEDAGLTVMQVPGTGETEISSERIFIDEKTADPFSSLPDSRTILTYFVNSIAYRGKSIPYSFVSSWDGLPLSESEIILNEWAADDLGLMPGDTVRISYFEIGPLRQLTEKTLPLQVKQIVPISGIYSDGELMPRIPGLADAGHCREWEAGVPVDLDKIRDKDEAYWNLYRGIPKAFISGSLARKIWSNRFGNVTAIRFPPGKLPEKEYRAIFTDNCNAATYGFMIRPVRAEGLSAAGNSVDFGQLFLGLSFFLLLSAILLTALLFRFNLENRENQTATLLQLGFNGRQISVVYLAEAFIAAIPGMLAGLIFALFYVKLIFLLLNSLWWDIVRAPVIFLKVEPLTLIISAGISLIIALISVVIPISRYLRKTIHALYLGEILKPKRFTVRMLNLFAIISIITGIIIVVFQLKSGPNINPALFFLSGGMLLTGFLLSFRIIITRPEQGGPIQISNATLWRRSLKRNPGRAMSIVILVGVGTFLVIATGANRRDVLGNAHEKNSGTGGFGYFAETTVPVLFDLNDPERRISEGLEPSFRVAQMMRIEGDDASCLNLNMISNPSILGCLPSDLKGRFSFQSYAAGASRSDPWGSLESHYPGGVIPAIADQTVIQWGLKMKIGDTLLYQAETGDTLRLKLTAGLSPSIFQGHVLVDQSALLRYYPSHSGTSVFLIDSRDEQLRDDLSNILRDNGIDIIEAPRRLAEFNSVTNTYLSIFFALGMLGLAVGTIGISVVIARTLIERKREFSIMLATGFRKTDLVALLFKEYAWLLMAGLLTGLFSSIIPLLPLLLTDNSPVSAGLTTLLFAGIALNGLLWIFFLTKKLIDPAKMLPSLNDV